MVGYVFTTFLCSLQSPSIKKNNIYNIHQVSGKDCSSISYSPKLSLYFNIEISTLIYHLTSKLFTCDAKYQDIRKTKKNIEGTTFLGRRSAVSNVTTFFLLYYVFMSICSQDLCASKKYKIMTRCLGERREAA